MNDLQTRLKLIAGKEPDYRALADLCDISQQAVKKWFGFGGTTNDLRMAHLFKVAEHYSVDPKWLGTGEGEPRPKRNSHPASDIPARRLDLIRAYGRLPDEVRFNIRGLIETLDRTLDAKYQEWSLREGVRAAARDSKTKEKA